MAGDAGRVPARPAKGVRRRLSAGQHTLQFKVVGKNASSGNHWMVFDRFELSPLS
ncbi:hypothetical protein ACIF8T_34430 [Streptomyces sp. NPDC085946]|uniref:hypothetical protein n=1 Tax=Streptomyces sp. NPDC085946 TaxID=3365744 RepID=UPI0037D03098